MDLTKNLQEKVADKILREVSVGDLIEICLDGKSFNRTDGENERYSGYVSSLRINEIGLSTMHPSNIGYEYEKEEKKITISLIKDYKIL